MNWLLTFLCSVFLFSLLSFQSFQSKDDKQILPAVRKTVEKNTERECVFVPCNCNSTTHQSVSANRNENENMDLAKPMTNSIPVTHFLKDFGKYPKNRIC